MVASSLEANHLQDIVSFIRKHEGEIITGSTEENNYGDTSYVFSTRESRVWQVDRDSGDVIDRGELLLDQSTSQIIFTFEWNQPIAWTPYDLLAWLQIARSNGTIHPIFETREVEGQEFDLPDFGTVLLAESLNSRIKMIKVKSRGYRNKERFITDIYFHLGGLDLYPEGVNR